MDTIDQYGQLLQLFLQEENQHLRDQLKSMDASNGGMSHVEERIIARLEDTINVLAQQIGELALENVTATQPAAVAEVAEKENAPVSEQPQ